jgi:hypothetical protein
LNIGSVAQQQQQQMQTQQQQCAGAPYLALQAALLRPDI